MNEEAICLVTQGDDAGASRSSTDAILDAADRGMLRNVSVMACGPEARYAADRLAGRRELCIGLHGTLNSEWDRVKWLPAAPPARIASLLDDGREFMPSPAALRARGFDPDHLLIEMQAQLDKLRALGLEPYYFDTHMRFEWIDERLPHTLREWCGREGLVYFTDVAEPYPLADSPVFVTEEDDLLAKSMPELLIDRVLAGLPQLKVGHAYLLLGHPDRDGEALRAFGSADYPSERVVEDRLAEHAMFTDGRLREALARKRIRISRYSDLTGRAGPLR